MKEHFSCRCKSDVLKCCLIQTCVVHTSNNSSQPSVVPSLKSMNPSWSNPVSVPTWSRLLLPLRKRPRYTQIRPIGTQRVFDFGFDEAPRNDDAHVCKYTFAAPILIFTRCSIVIGSVLSVTSVSLPQRSTVCKHSLERTVSFDSVELIEYARDT